MSFKKLKVDELIAVAEFFAVDVESVSDGKPKKDEIITALQAGDDPVTWEDYTDIYLQQLEADPSLKTEEPVLEVPEKKPIEKNWGPEDEILVKFTGLNPTYVALGMTWSKKHPFHMVEKNKAEWLIKNGPFAQALPSEVADFYN